MATVSLPVATRGLCVVESPLKASNAIEFARNIRFARNVCNGLCYEGYAPYASHLFYTQFLDDDLPMERNMGISYGLLWADKANVVFFCLPPGRGLNDSKGMTLALERHQMNSKITMMRQYDEEGKELLSEIEL